MTSNPYHIKLVDTHREPEKNEFFFTHNPYRTTGLRELLEYLEKNHGFTIEMIDKWKIKSLVQNDPCRYEAGIKLTKSY